MRGINPSATTGRQWHRHCLTLWQVEALPPLRGLSCRRNQTQGSGPRLPLLRRFAALGNSPSRPGLFIHSFCDRRYSAKQKLERDSVIQKDVPVFRSVRIGPTIIADAVACVEQAAPRESYGNSGSKVPIVILSAIPVRDDADFRVNRLLVPEDHSSPRSQERCRSFV